MKSGMIAAEVVAAALQAERVGEELVEFTDIYQNSWAYQELHTQRNFGPAHAQVGHFSSVRCVYAFIDVNIFNGKLPWTLTDPKPDHAQMKPAADCKKIDYPKPDGKLTFDKLSSVFLSSTNHAEDQPCHLKLTDDSIPLGQNLPMFDEPAQRYCPAGVYEIVEEANGDKRFQINSQNCVHCKTCDIKDPAQNITWVVPEGTGGPNYPNM